MFGINDALIKLDEQGTPIRCAFIGAGAMGMNFIGQTFMSPGMKPLVVVDIKIDNAVHALKMSGCSADLICETNDVAEAQKAIDAGKYVCTTNVDIVYGVDNIDVVCECTGVVNVGTKYCFDAIRAGKHCVTLSVEMDVVVGNMLALFAKQAGVTFTGIYGDEPGVIKELYDKADALGFTVVCAGRGDTGNSDLKWNPETVNELLAERARKRGVDLDKMRVNRYMFASFNDGSKTNEELTMFANSTGLVPDVRGCHHPLVKYDNWQADVAQLCSLESMGVGGFLSQPGCVESIGIDTPNNQGKIKCFVVVTTDNEAAAQGLKYHGSGGPGPCWCWYEDIHWVGNTAPLSIAYAALYNTPSVAAVKDKRAADTVTMAKKDLKAGETLDTIGGYSVAGRIEKARIAKAENLLPLGLSTNCVVKKDFAQGEWLTYDDVEFPNTKDIVYLMRRLQDEIFETV